MKLLKLHQQSKSLGIERVAHLPCIGLTKEDVSDKLQELKERGIENILALRGDIRMKVMCKGILNMRLI